MNWTIVGCGWLGTSLGEVLVQNGNAVIGTTTTLKNKENLAKKGIKNVAYFLNSQISTEIIDYTDVAVLSIPPFKREHPSAYGQALVQLAQQFNSNTHFIFLGSTGVYPQKNGVYSEEYTFEKDAKNTSLFQAEKQLSELLKDRLTILRLGGLFGSDRHPIFSLSGKKDVKNPEGKINFAGSSDIITAIQMIVEQEAFGEIFNIVYPEYPSRKKYYTEKAEELNLEAPKFSESTSVIREVSSRKIQSKLNFIFKQKI